MMDLASQIRKLGFVLIYFSMISLAYAGGSFTHGHELIDNGDSYQAEHSHIDQQDVDQAHDHDPDVSIDNTSLHCGAMILTLLTAPAALPALAEADKLPSLMSDLIAIVVSLEPPPPRFA